MKAGVMLNKTTGDLSQDDLISATRICSYCHLEVLRTAVCKDSKGRYSCRSCRVQGRHLSRWRRFLVTLGDLFHGGK